MKCAFVNLGKHFGGVENYLIIIVKEWIEEGNEALLVVKKDSQFAKRMADECPNVELIQVDYKISDFIKVKKKIKQEKVEIIDINGINSGIFMYGIKKVKKITTVHSNSEMDRIDKSFLIRKLFVTAEKVCLKKSKQIIAVSEAIKELLITRGVKAEKIEVVHNGVKKIDYTEEEMKKSEDKTKICFVGRLEKVKGCEYLLKALNELKSTEAKFECDIFGDGSLKESLENYVSDNDLNAYVNFKGFSSQIRRVLPQYDVVVLPSLYEAFPLTIPEAMNANVLVVCSNAGGMPYIIKDNINGYVFEKCDYKALSNILYKISSSKCDRYKIIETAYSEFIEKYTEEVMVSNTFNVLYTL